MNLQKYVEVEEPEEEELEIMAAEKELSGLDNQFDSSMLLDSDLGDSMQIHDGDDSLDDTDGDLDTDDDFDNSSADLGDDDMSDDFSDDGDDF